MADVVTALTGALGTVATGAIGAIGDIVPIAAPIMGAMIIIRLGIRAFNRIGH